MMLPSPAATSRRVASAASTAAGALDAPALDGLALLRSAAIDGEDAAVGRPAAARARSRCSG
jgi:hypothetical protein